MAHGSSGMSAQPVCDSLCKSVVKSSSPSSTPNISSLRDLRAFVVRSSSAFTLVEMLVAVAILAITLGAMGVIFRMSMDAYRASTATAEVMQKLRAITAQLDSDFKGLRKDGVIFIAWGVADDVYAPNDYSDAKSRAGHKYHRDDKILFFANGDFQSYADQQTVTAGKQKPVKGNIARISYMMARDKAGNFPYWYSDEYTNSKNMRDIRRRTRILARDQHIVTSDPDFGGAVAYPDFPTITRLPAGGFVANDYLAKENLLEYDSDGLLGWTHAPHDDLYELLSACSGIRIYGNTAGGLVIDSDMAADVHLTFVEGLNDLKIQAWYNDSRWYPDTGDVNSVTGKIEHSDFYVDNPSDPTNIITNGVLGEIIVNGKVISNELNGADSDLFLGGFPGLGRALKFTFKLYDSRGFFRDGLTFTHIVYLGDNQ
jgi:prepilin-type N-terminal cleavage/methylation domain-containing protein